MIAFFIKFILCSGFLYSFYKLFLERESMYKINRFYLLFSLIFSLIAPFYKINLPITAQETNISPELLAFLMQNPELLHQEKGINFGDILNIICFSIGFLLLARFMYNLYELIFKIKTEEKIKDQEITYILDLESIQPYSFWNYIFIPKKQLKNLHQNLIDHEKAHCIQKHSFDILLIETFQILFWFNPFIYFYKKSIKLNHEFLADEYVLLRNSDLKTYQHQILDCIATQNPSLMASNFNFILTKKRLLMMTKNTSKRKVKILSFASLPFILSAFVLFSQKTFAQEVEKSAQKVENALDKPVKSQADLIFGTETNPIYTDTISKNLSKEGRTMTKEELKTILKKNPQNKIILNDAGDIILNDSIKIKDIVLQKATNPVILYDNDGKILQQINAKDIEKMFVNKTEGYIEIVKKDSGVVRILNSALPKAKDLKVTSTFKEKNNITLKNISFNGVDIKNVELKDGYSIYTDKNGVEHKIISSEIDKVYLENQLKLKGTDIGVRQNDSKSRVVDKAEIERQIKEAKARGYDVAAVRTDIKNPWSITVQPTNNHQTKTLGTYKIDSKDFKNEDEIKKVGRIRVETAYNENNLSLNNALELRKKSLQLQEANTKKMLKEVEKQQRELKHQEKNN